MNILQALQCLQNLNKLMKYYYYLLFRIFNSLSNPIKKNDNITINILLINTSTLIIYFTLYTFFTFIDFYFVKFLNNIITGNFAVLIVMGAIGFINYWFLIKPKKFLHYGFKADKTGGYLLVCFIIIIAFAFVFIANKNRDKIFKEQEKVRIEDLGSFQFSQLPRELEMVLGVC